VPVVSLYFLMLLKISIIVEQGTQNGLGGLLIPRFVAMGLFFLLVIGLREDYKQ
jgi:hypothetical protein